MCAYVVELMATFEVGLTSGSEVELLVSLAARLFVAVQA